METITFNARSASFAALRQFAADHGVTITGDRRKKASFISAIEMHIDWHNHNANLANEVAIAEGLIEPECPSNEVATTLAGVMGWEYCSIDQHYAAFDAYLDEQNAYQPTDEEHTAAFDAANAEVFGEVEEFSPEATIEVFTVDMSNLDMADTALTEANVEGWQYCYLSCREEHIAANELLNDEPAIADEEVVYLPDNTPAIWEYPVMKFVSFLCYVAWLLARLVHYRLSALLA